jgi:methylenetetrahydrofolate reductase (NADPH)
LVQKQRAGAAVAVLNYTRPSDVATFMQQAKATGLTIPVIAGVAVYTDLRSAAGLDALPGLRVDHAMVEHVVSAADPIEAGIQRAVAEAHALLGIDGVAGVNLSGLASDRGFGFAAGVKADIARRIRAEQVA